MINAWFDWARTDLCIVNNAGKAQTPEDLDQLAEMLTHDVKPFVDQPTINNESPIENVEVQSQANVEVIENLNQTIETEPEIILGFPKLCPGRYGHQRFIWCETLIPIW